MIGPLESKIKSIYTSSPSLAELNIPPSVPVFAVASRTLNSPNCGCAMFSWSIYSKS